jgi:amidase
MGTALTTPDPRAWETEADKCRQIREQSIPTQWLLNDEALPPQSRLNVLQVPSESGTLSVKELEITESDATSLTDRMGSGTWTAEEVTVAFLKRATIGHQLASVAFSSSKTHALTEITAQQCHRNHGRRRDYTRKRARHIFRKA